jgi:peptidoglycan/xylan/chitin deacetylase (PgdA/CDA1 family)
VLTGLGAAAVSGFGIISAETAFSQAQRVVPLQFYGGYASAIRPNLTPPSASGGAVLWSGRTDSRQVALTFDDGPMPDWTPTVLRTLARHDIPATFFLKGINVLHHGGIHRDWAGLHELGNHTWDHPDLARLDYHECTEQIERTSAIMAEVYGIRPTLFRPPYGHIAGSSLLAAAEQRLTTVLWNAQATESAFTGKPAGIVASVRNAVRPGSIILGHDTGSRDRLIWIEHLDAFISGLKADGFTFTTVSKLCRLR